jgi:hypothetical protein
MLFYFTGLELYGRFWLTAPARPKDQVASGYLAEAIFVCERWGAHAKAQLIRSTYASVLSLNGGRAYVGEGAVAEVKKGAARRGKGGKPKKPVSNYSFSLDLETVVQASQTISKEVCLSSYLFFSLLFFFFLLFFSF